MGDRCWVALRIKRHDLPAFAEALNGSDWDFWDEDNSDPRENFLTLEMQEMNYAGEEGFEKLAEAGFVFCVHHGPGGTYGEGMYAAFEGQFASVASSDGSPVVCLSVDTGKPIEHSMQEAQDFLKIDRQAWAYLNAVDMHTAWARLSDIWPSPQTQEAKT